jgi:hypothetical protein
MKISKADAVNFADSLRNDFVAESHIPLDNDWAIVLSQGLYSLWLNLQDGKEQNEWLN